MVSQRQSKDYAHQFIAERLGKERKKTERAMQQKRRVNRDRLQLKALIWLAGYFSALIAANENIMNEAMRESYAA